MIDLCIDARMAFSSGIGTCIRQLVPFFNKPPFRVILLVDRLDQAWCKGIEQILFPTPIYSIGEQIAFPLKIPQSDLFWSPHYNVPLLPVRVKKRITTIHDVCHLALGKYLSRAERIYAKFVMGKALRKSNSVITDSHFSENEIQKYFGRQKNLNVIPVAVNQLSFKRIFDPNVIQSVRKKYTLPERFVLYVGNVKPHKNLSGLVRAFSQVSIPDLSLVLVGKNKSMEKMGKALAIGEVPEEDLPVLYSMAELFVFPSFYEGFGLPPLEAMSCGCPTIVSNAASLPEVCGDGTYYFHPESTEEIADAIVKVVTDEGLKKRLVAKGFERIKSFNWDETGRRYRELFEKVHLA